MLCHPSSVDSLSTSAGTEDHVSMGGYSARKAVKVVENVERGIIVATSVRACAKNKHIRIQRTRNSVFLRSANKKCKENYESIKSS